MHYQNDDGDADDADGNTDGPGDGHAELHDNMDDGDDDLMGVILVTMMTMVITKLQVFE